MKLLFLIFCVLIAAKEGFPQTTQPNTVLLAKAINDFNARFYNKVATGNTNVVISPMSIHVVLSMAYLGARNTTAAEMNAALGLNIFPTSMAPHQAYQDLLQELKGASPVSINLANGIFINSNFNISTNYKNDVSTYYQALVENIDLAAPGGPEKKINDFVKDATEDLITEILPPGTINDKTAVILVNAIYFNASWLDQFSKDKTKQRQFNKVGGPIQLESLYDERTVPIKRNVLGLADVAEMKFVGANFSLFVIVPHAVNKLAALEKEISKPGILDKMFKNLQPTRVRFSIPKVKIETSVKLTSPLKKIFLRRAFNPSQADFSGISDSPLFISEVVHEAKIELDETGTVAAAATAGIIGTTSIEQPPKDKFFADRPFLLCIRNNFYGQVLFLASFWG